MAHHQISSLSVKVTTSGLGPTGDRDSSDRAARAESLSKSEWMSFDPDDFEPEPGNPLIRCPRDLGDDVPDHEVWFGDPQPVQDLGGGGPTGEFVYDAHCLACDLDFPVRAVRR
jgi:hypothetical protein